MIKLEDNTIISENQFDLIKPCTEKVPNNFKTSIEYDKYLLRSLPQTFRDGLFSYKIPYSFKLYSKNANMGSQEKFYFNKVDTPSNNPHEYVLIRPIELFDLNSRSNKQSVGSNSNKSDIMNYGRSKNFDGFIFSNNNSVSEITIIDPEKYLKKAQM